MAALRDPCFNVRRARLAVGLLLPARPPFHSPPACGVSLMRLSDPAFPGAAFEEASSESWSPARAPQASISIRFGGRPRPAVSRAKIYPRLSSKRYRPLRFRAQGPRFRRLRERIQTHWAVHEVPERAFSPPGHQEAGRWPSGPILPPKRRRGGLARAAVFVSQGPQSDRFRQPCWPVAGGSRFQGHQSKDGRKRGRTQTSACANPIDDCGSGRRPGRDFRPSRAPLAPSDVAMRTRSHL